jgi:CarboxypepD_reg-like domain
MEKIIFISALCFFSIPLFSQNSTLKGTVVNSQNNEPVIYATVGLIKANKGVSTDEKGQFELENVDSHDTLLISCVGFKILKLPILKVKNERIRLEQSNIQLKEITVKPKKSKILKLNNFKSTKDVGVYLSYNTTDDFNQSQMAQPFENPDGTTWFIKEIRIARMATNVKHKKETTKFRVRFYGIDNKGMPDGKDMYQPILVFDKSNDIIKVDVSDKKMGIPPSGLFVAIEWLKIAENYQDITFEMPVRKGDKIVGRKEYNRKYFTPIVGMLKSFERNEKCNAYTLDYKNEWALFHCGSPVKEWGVKNLAISLTIYD